MRWFTFTLCGVLLAVLVRMSLFTVDPTEFVYVTQFGAPVATYDGGARDSDAGLYFRLPWPIQSVQRLDRRLQNFDLPPIETSMTRFRPRIRAGGWKARFTASECCV